MTHYPTIDAAIDACAQDDVILVCPADNGTVDIVGPDLAPDVVIVDSPPDAPAR